MPRMRRKKTLKGGHSSRTERWSDMQITSDSASAAAKLGHRPAASPAARGDVRTLLPCLHHLPPPKTISRLLPDGTSETSEHFVSSIRPTRVYVPGALVGDIATQIGLFQALALPHIAVHAVDVGDNALGDTSDDIAAFGVLPALADALSSEHCLISDLALYGNCIDDSAAVEISRGLRHNATLEDLNLADNKMSGEGIAALCQALLHGGAPLGVLDLDRNAECGDVGACAIATLLDAAREPQCEITSLHLGRCGVGGEGVEALCAALGEARAAGISTLETLELDGNAIGERGALALAALMRDDSADACGITLEISLLGCTFGGVGGPKSTMKAGDGGWVDDVTRGLKELHLATKYSTSGAVVVVVDQ